MKTFLAGTWLSYAIAGILVLCVLLLPTFRKSTHTGCWRWLFPTFAAVHISITWLLLEQVFQYDDAQSISEHVLDALCIVWCGLTFLCNVVYRATVWTCRYDLEFHVPIAFGSVLSSMVFSLMTSIVITFWKKRTNDASQQAH